MGQVVRASSAAPVNTEGGGVLEHELRHARRPVLEAHTQRRQHLQCIWAGRSVSMGGGGCIDHPSPRPAPLARRHLIAQLVAEREQFIGQRLRACLAIDGTAAHLLGKGDGWGGCKRR